MRLLGIDYGRRKMGLALAEGVLAEPLTVIRYKDPRALGEQLKKIIKENNIEKVVVGVSEGKMGKESKEFSLNLSQSLRIPVEIFDETLSTYEAQRLSMETGLKRTKRKSLEDAFAAVVMLQAYIDFH